MSKEGKIVFCTGGGCTAKLGAGALSRILEKLPRGARRPVALLVGTTADDAAVYRITDDIALVQTVDFFPPMVDDPYTFGQIAAANALSDVYAMGGEVKTALNLVCFPESMDLNILGEILRGGAKKVAEAGGSLAGGHSIADTGVKYGLSVTGLVDPKKMYTNDSGRPGDKLILTKALGVGLICTANRVGEAAPEDMAGAIASMTTLNKNAAEISRKYTVHAATDVTGFSFLGHLHEMMGESFPVSLMHGWCRFYREPKKRQMIFCILLPDSATATIPAHMSLLKMCRLQWKRCCLTHRLPADYCWPCCQKKQMRWKQSCRPLACPQRSWVRSYPKPNRKSL